MRAQVRGFATLAVTILLLSAMVLAALFVNRSLIVEQQSAANQLRSAQAFEAAEAGLEWATAQLNGTGAVDAQCHPSEDRSARSFRDRHLRIDPESGRISLEVAAVGDHVTTAHPQAACIRNDDTWICSCPSSGSPAPAGSPTEPAFVLDIAPGERAGVVRVQSSGCTRYAAGCASPSTGSSEANARVSASLALVPALRVAPGSALNAAGAISLGGGNIMGGVPTSSPSRLFATYFGIGKTHWKQQPAVTRLDCASDCTNALRALLDTGLGARSHPSLIWVDGDVTIDAPAAIGSAEQPMIIVASGALRLSGGVRIHGVIYAANVTWTGATSPGAELRGAIVSESNIVIDGTPPLIRDGGVLAVLQRARGSFVRVPGSWRDF